MTTIFDLRRVVDVVVDHCMMEDRIDHCVGFLRRIVIKNEGIITIWIWIRKI